MNYYIGEIDTFIGESEMSITFKFKTTGTPEDYMDSAASTFWGEYDEDSTEPESGIYYFGDRAAAAGRFQSITKEVFDAIQMISEI